MYTAVIQAEGCEDKDGMPIPVGTIIYHHDAWQLCLPAELNFMGLPPRATAGDEETAAKVQEEAAKLSPAIAAEKVLLQKRLNRLAAKFPKTIDKATGDFARNNKGELAKELDAVAVHVITLAQNRGIKPQLAADEAAKAG